MKLAPLAACLALLGCAGGPPTSSRDAPAAHRGPVSALAHGGGQFWSCSVAGVFRGHDAGIARVARPAMRSFELALRPNASGEIEILVGGGEPAVRGSVCLIGARGRVIAERDLADDLVYAVAVHPDGTRALAGCADGRVLELALPSLEPRAELCRHSAPVRSVAWSADGSRWASGGRDGNLFLGSTAVGDAGHRVEPAVLVDHTAGVECVGFAGAMLVSGSRDGRLRIHDERGNLLMSTDPLGASVLALIARSAAGRISLGLSDGRILTYDPESHLLEPIATLASPVYSLAEARDGALAAGTVSDIAIVR